MMLRVRAERLKRHWTQTMLGARARLSASDISRIESGRFRPYPQQAARLARALKIPAEELLEPVEFVAEGVNHPIEATAS